MLLCCLATVFALPLPAQDSVRTKKVSILPLPVLFYMPETRLGFGALTSGVFNLGDADDTRSSNVQVLGAYTINDQIISSITNTIFTNEERFAIFGEIAYFDFPIFYYGVGNDTDEDNEEDLDYQVVLFEQRLLRQVRPAHFLGVQYRFVNLYDLDYEPVFLLEDAPRLRNDQGTYSGFGPSYLYDSRDNVLSAFKGTYLELSAVFHSSVIGSEFNFTRYRIDGRRYWLLNETTVLAAQFIGEFNNGDVPFRELALMGGDQIMRGYYQGRYRDKNQVAAQGEYRRQLKPWLGVVAFGAVGEVASAVDKFDITNFKWTAGGGVRITVNRTERSNIRIDYGIGNGTAGLYFAFAESF